MGSLGQFEYWMGDRGTGSTFSKTIWDPLAHGANENPIDNQSVAISAAARAATYGASSHFGGALGSAPGPSPATRLPTR
jgi:hypothetical protein